MKDLKVSKKEIQNLPVDKIGKKVMKNLKSSCKKLNLLVGKIGKRVMKDLNLAEK